jgi:alkaline phosphatase
MHRIGQNYSSETVCGGTCRILPSDNSGCICFIQFDRYNLGIYYILESLNKLKHGRENIIKNTLSKILALFLCLAVMLGIYFGIAKADTPGAPQNIIFMIGDGMGQNHVHMAHDAMGFNLNMENMPYACTCSTANAAGEVTDSAAAGTALACGIKTTNGYIGMDPLGESFPNLREFLAQKGKRTRLVSTVSITDATLAAFGAHNISRKNQTEIAEEYIKNNIDIMMGGGGSYFDADLRNLATTEKGYTLITTKD